MLTVLVAYFPSFNLFRRKNIFPPIVTGKVDFLNAVRDSSSHRFYLGCGFCGIFSQFQGVYDANDLCLEWITGKVYFLKHGLESLNHRYY